MLPPPASTGPAAGQRPRRPGTGRRLCRPRARQRAAGASQVLQRQAEPPGGARHAAPGREEPGHAEPEPARFRESGEDGVAGIEPAVWGRCAACARQRRVRPVRVDRNLPARSRRRHTSPGSRRAHPPQLPAWRSGVSGPGRAGADRPRDSGLRGTYRVPRGPTGGSRSRRGGSRSAAGATDFNSVHVKNYVSCDQGLTKTVEMLHLKAYGDIRSALASGSRDRRQGRSAPDPLIHDRP